MIRHARSASTDLARAQRLIERNRRILHQRWKEKLAQRPWLDDLPFYPHRIIAARDTEELDRILLILDRIPPQDPRDALSRLVHEMAALWPTARITVMAVDSRDAERNAPSLLDRGVEVLTGVDDWEDWFARRRYHYTVAIMQGSGNVERFSGVLSETQPQAVRAYYGAEHREDEQFTLPHGPGQTDQEFRRSLIDAMAHLGTEPPEPRP